MSITEMLDKSELLAQLAEESAELSQAALKLRRAIMGINPTPKTIANCEVSLDEEIADAELCLEELGLCAGFHLELQNVFMTEKRKRWLTRLLERHGEV